MILFLVNATLITNEIPFLPFLCRVHSYSASLMLSIFDGRVTPHFVGLWTRHRSGAGSSCTTTTTQVNRQGKCDRWLKSERMKPDIGRLNGEDFSR